jgi:uncharacterized protein YukJ
MSNTYGFLKGKVLSKEKMVPSRHHGSLEAQYHIHATIRGNGHDRWDTATNVGTDDSDDLLRYKIVFDFSHPIMKELRAADPGFKDLTGTRFLPALDFLRSDILSGTGPWRLGGPMDGSEDTDPAKSLARLLDRARSSQADVYFFGRAYKSGGLGIHDIHMNQGSSGSFVNNGESDANDHNDIWQDGAVIVDLGDKVAAYFTSFIQQLVPTDDLGNQAGSGHEIDISDEGSQSNNQ